MTMLSASYIVAAAAMFAALLYLLFRLRLFITTTTMLVGGLLLIYGPAFLSFTLSSGEHGFLLHRLTGSVGGFNPIFPLIKSKVPNFDAIIIAMNFSVAMMYVSIIVGIETIDFFFAGRVVRMRAALSQWNTQPLRDSLADHRVLLLAILILAVFMFFTSIREHHIAIIRKFLSITVDDNSATRNAFRLHFAASPNYLYRLTLDAIAPTFIVWGLLAGGLRRSWPLFLAASLLLLAALIGKFETLSKAPPAFFLVQLMIAALLVFTNKISWKVGLGISIAVALVLYAITRLIVVFPEGSDIFGVVYYRVFEVGNEALLENFATFPFMHPYMWGANLRPIAMLMGIPYVPSFSIVAHTWYGNYDISVPALFIADARTDFAYAGVIVYSIVAGAACRAIDAVTLVRGKTVIAVAVLCATFIGVFTLLVTAINTAFLSGGLLLAPLLVGSVVATTHIWAGNRWKT